MRVAFDGACLGDGPITGVARAFLNGLFAYAAAGDVACDLLVPAGAAAPRLAGVRCVEAPRGALSRQVLLPRLLRRLGADVLHSSVASVPLRSPCPTIATVHDLPWLHAEAAERSTHWRRFATRRALRAASAVIAPSRFTLADARLLLGGDAKLHHVPHGTAGRSESPRGARTGSTPGAPFLVLGDDRPRKNRERVRAAHALAAKARADLPPLRFVGPPDDYVQEEEKLRLLRSCAAVVQCSTFEGFGMPVLEAMAQGALVVCSDIPPFRELAGDAALFVDPLDVASIAEGLLSALDATTHDRLARAGWRRAVDFSAERTAGRWRALHAQLVAR